MTKLICDFCGAEMKFGPVMIEKSIQIEGKQVKITITATHPDSAERRCDICPECVARATLRILLPQPEQVTVPAE